MMEELSYKVSLIHFQFLLNNQPSFGNSPLQYNSSQSDKSKPLHNPSGTSKQPRLLSLFCMALFTSLNARFYPTVFFTCTTMSFRTTM